MGNTSAPRSRTISARHAQGCGIAFERDGHSLEAKEPMHCTNVINGCTEATAAPRRRNTSQFIARQRSAGVQRDLASSSPWSRQLARRPRNLAVRHAEPDQIGIQARVGRIAAVACTFLANARALRRDALLSPETISLMRYPARSEFQRQSAAQPSGPNNRDAWFEYHGRSIAGRFRRQQRRDTGSSPAAPPLSL